MKSFKIRSAAVVALLPVVAVATPAFAHDHGAKATAIYAPITQAEVEAAQKAWCGALVAIATEHDTKGHAAAKILAGRQVAPGFQLNVIPTSQEIMAAAANEGLIGTLVAAGAFVSSPSCDYCFGRIATMTQKQRAVSTGTLNVRGRMGSTDSEIYLCSAASVAAAAIEGAIADPRKYW